MFLKNCTHNLKNITINNSLGMYGGAIAFVNPRLTNYIKDTVLTYNEAQKSGGAIYIENNIEITDY